MIDLIKFGKNRSKVSLGFIERDSFLYYSNRNQTFCATLDFFKGLHRMFDFCHYSKE